MARSRSFVHSATLGSLAIASVAVPTISMAPAANAAEEPVMAEVSGFTASVSADAQTTPFVQQSVTTDINLPASFGDNWELRSQPEDGVSFSAGKISYTRSGVLAYDSGTISGTGIAKFSNKADSSFAEIGATGPGVRVADGSLRQPILISVGNMHRSFDVTVAFSANGSATAELPQEAIDAAKAQGVDLSGTTITVSTATSALSATQEKFPAVCWTPSTSFANTIDMSRSKGIVRVGDSFIIPAGVTVDSGNGYKTAKLPATIAIKGNVNTTLLSPELKVSDEGFSTVSTTLSAITGTTSANGAIKFSDYQTPIFSTYSDTFDWSVSSGSFDEAAFGGQVNTAFGSPFMGTVNEFDLGTMEAGCVTHTKELAEAHSQLFGSSNASSSAVSFTDVNENSAFAADILWAADKGIVRGYGDGSFKPDANISRDAMAAFLYRMAGSPAFEAPAVSPFKDGPTYQPFYTEIAWLASQGITTGYADGTFHPGESVNRDAMAAFLYRFAGSPAYTAPETSAFADVPTGSQFYKEISWLASKGISTGWSDGTFRPVNQVQRNAMTAFIHRFNDNVKQIG